MAAVKKGFVATKSKVDADINEIYIYSNPVQIMTASFAQWWLLVRVVYIAGYQATAIRVSSRGASKKQTCVLWVF